MNITTIAMALNIAIGASAWLSDISLMAKIIITVVAVVKFSLFFYTAWMSDGNDRIRKIGMAILVVLNIGIIAYSLFSCTYPITLTVSGTLIMLLIWAFATVFDFSSKS